MIPGETFESMRYEDKSNAAMLRHLSQKQLGVWKNFSGPATMGTMGPGGDELVVEVLGGAREAEALFMMGETAGTCKQACQHAPTFVVCCFRFKMGSYH